MQDHGRLSVVHNSKHSLEKKTSTHVLDSLVRTTKKGELWARFVRADASTCASDPQLFSYRRRFQMGETLEKLAHMFRLLGPCLETLVRRWHTCFDSLVRVAQQQRWKDQKKKFSLSVTVWEPGTGGQDMGTRSSRSRFPHDEMDTVLNKKERQRTMMASGAASETEGGVMFDWSRLWLWAATLHGDRESHRLRPSTSPTRHRGLRVPQKAQQIREPFQSRSGS